MFRMTKLTDYGIVLLTQFAAHDDRVAHTARELALETRLPLPTVGKLLKQLSHGGLLASQRGTKGGYVLAQAAARDHGLRDHRDARGARRDHGVQRTPSAASTRASARRARTGRSSTRRSAALSRA